MKSTEKLDTLRTIIADLLAAKSVKTLLRQKPASNETDILMDPLKAALWADKYALAMDIRNLISQTMGIDLANMAVERHLLVKEGVGFPCVQLIYLGPLHLGESEINTCAWHCQEFIKRLFSKPSESENLFEDSDNRLPDNVLQCIMDQCQQVLEQRGETNSPKCSISIGGLHMKIQGRYGLKPAKNNFTPVKYNIQGIRDGISISGKWINVIDLSGKAYLVEFDPSRGDRSLGDTFLDSVMMTFSVLEYRQAQGKQAFSLLWFTR